VSVETKPVSLQADMTEVTVKTVILRPGAPPIPANYEMEKTASGWKMFDLTVEGISLVATHRNSFGEKVQQAGIDGLIKSLMQLNNEQANAPADKADAK
jgi:phospholipid transport system substrate-binding protein